MIEYLTVYRLKTWRNDRKVAMVGGSERLFILRSQRILRETMKAIGMHARNEAQVLVEETRTYPISSQLRTLARASH